MTASDDDSGTVRVGFLRSYLADNLRVRDLTPTVWWDVFTTDDLESLCTYNRLLFRAHCFSSNTLE